MCGEEGQPETDSFKCFGIALSRTGNFFKTNRIKKKEVVHRLRRLLFALLQYARNEH